MSGLTFVLGVIFVLIIIALLEKCVSYIFVTQGRLSEYILEEEYPILWRGVAFLIWLPFTLLVLIFMLLGIGSAIYLANRARDWWHKR